MAAEEEEAKYLLFAVAVAEHGSRGEMKAMHHLSELACFHLRHC